MAMTYLLKINGTDLTEYISSYKTIYAKLWRDSDRNMAGELKAKYLGLYPKIALEFRMMTDTELATVLSLINLQSFTVAWWDAKTQTYKSGTYYSNDPEPELFSIHNKMYKSFGVNLIPFKRSS